MKISKYQHRPVHIYKDNSIYFITSRTLNNIKYFHNNYRKELIKQSLLKAFKTYRFSLFAYAILDNHFHLLLKTNNGLNISTFIASIKGKCAIEINKIDNCQNRKIWYQYWDRCIRSEKDFYSHLNYIHYNPIKHKLINNLIELQKYEFCSYKNWLENKGPDWINSCFENYPIINIL